MLAILKYWQIGAGAVLGALLAAGPVYLYGKHDQRQETAAATAIETAKAYQERAELNDKIQNLDASALCLELGGLRDECTANLRGISKDTPVAPNSGLPLPK